MKLCKGCDMSGSPLWDDDQLTPPQSQGCPPLPQLCTMHSKTFNFVV